MNNIISGIHYFISGLSLITKPGLKRFVLMPLMINIIIFIGLFFVMRHYMGEFNDWFAHHLPVWLQWLGGLLWLLFFISFFLFFVYAFITLANIVAAPFNGLLAEKVELYLTGILPEPRSLFDLIKDVPRILLRQLSIIAYYLPRALCLFILFFIPVVHLVAPVLWFLFNAWFMTLTYIDYPTDNHRVPLITVRRWLRENNWTSLGLGMTILVVSMIPIINFIVIPAAVAAATRYWIEAAASIENR